MSDGAQHADKEMSAVGEEEAAEQRTLITRAALELALAEDVRKNPDCGAFVGVIVERVVPGSSAGANWAIKGIKFGKVERGRCSAVISGCVHEFQNRFNISD
jgi:hypothetical protein